METDNGGWLVIQRRTPGGRVNFSRSWDEYETGFGDLNGEFWYGLRNLHCLTLRDDVELRFDFVNENGVHQYTTFDTFKVGGAGEKYKLTIGGGAGYLPGHIAYHDGMSFSTTDQDNDQSSGNCALNSGGWWYNNCYYARFNGVHGDTFQWGYGGAGQLASMDMKVRPKTCAI